jgi:hypothetical protein
MQSMEKRKEKSVLQPKKNPKERRAKRNRTHNKKNWKIINE